MYYNCIAWVDFLKILISYVVFNNYKKLKGFISVWLVTSTDPSWWTTSDKTQFMNIYHSLDDSYFTLTQGQIFDSKCTRNAAL